MAYMRKEDDDDDERILEGVFAVAKPSLISSADVLLKLQAVFAASELFAPLLRSQPSRPSKSTDQVFKMGHGGTLDPLATGVLIVGIGRGTKHLQQYLACTKTYETVVAFGTSTDSYDCTGAVIERSDCQHVTRQVVEGKLGQFRGAIAQTPPTYSALKINGVKACEYVRQGKDLPRHLESRQMQVDECKLLEWLDNGEPRTPSARIRLTVSSGFYVRSFAHDLGIACGTSSHMTALRRIRQATFMVADSIVSSEVTPALTYDDLDSGEHVWGAKLRPQLEAWVDSHQPARGHVNGRDRSNKRKTAEDKLDRPKQRFRGGWVADTKQERIEQQGGKYKGKWSRKRETGNSIMTTRMSATSHEERHE